MTLVELAQKWKDKKLTPEETVEESKRINIFEPYEYDGDWFYTNGNDNSWLDVEVKTDLTKAERIELKRLMGLIR